MDAISNTKWEGYFNEYDSLFEAAAQMPEKGLVTMISSSSEEAVCRAIDCVNALQGVEDPVRMRQTWDAVKDLELDAYWRLKDNHDTLLKAFQNLVNAIKFNNALNTEFVHDLVEAEKVLDKMKGVDQ